MSITKLSYAFLSLLAVTVVLFFLNTQLSISNDRLYSDIERYKEEKMILRAKYFSNISAKTLAAKANSMGMTQADSNEIIGINSASFTKQNLIEQAVSSFAGKLSSYLRKPELIVSGY